MYPRRALKLAGIGLALGSLSACDDTPPQAVDQNPPAQVGSPSCDQKTDPNCRQNSAGSSHGSSYYNYYNSGDDRGRASTAVEPKKGIGTLAEGPVSRGIVGKAAIAHGGGASG